MTKIYEALEQANQERALSRHEATMHPLVVKETLGPTSSIEETMAGLYQNIFALLPNGTGGRVVQFIASQRGEGTSILVREFAKVCSRKLGKKVLLLDADQHHPAQPVSFGIRPETDWRHVVKDGREIADALYQVEQSNLFISQLSMNTVALPPIFDSPQMNSLLEQLRREFDLIVVDSPPGTTSADGLAIVRKMDGVVLVVEAEKTRWQVAEHVIQRIENQGGKVLGVLLNKRRYPVPGFIYKRF